MALASKLSVLKKNPEIWTPFNVQIPLNDAFFQNKENKIFWTPQRLRDTNGRDMATHTRVCLYQQPVTWIFTRSRLSYSNYKVIPLFEIIIQLKSFFKPVVHHL